MTILYALNRGGDTSQYTILGGMGIFIIFALWLIFKKAGESGWKSIIPFLNLYTLYKITWGNGWVFLTLIIPIVNIVIYIIMLWKLAKSFNKGVLFLLGLIFLPNLFCLILGLGSSQYRRTF